LQASLYLLQFFADYGDIKTGSHSYILELFCFEHALPPAEAGGRHEGMSAVHWRCQMPERVCLTKINVKINLL